VTQYSNSPWEKKLAFYLLSRPGIGRRTVHAVLTHISEKQIKPDMIRSQLLLHSTLQSIFIKNDISIDINEIENFFNSKNDQYESQGISVIFISEKEYPPSLLTIEDPPVFLFCKGDASLLQTPGVGVVGTRKITAYGRFVTEKITRELVLDGISTVSGCMYGVDEVVHKVTLENNGATIAVLGYGFNKVYPARMQPLLDRIIQNGGAVVSEYFPEDEPIPAYFVARNRIIAGLSHSVIVTEAAQKSGSHGTALFATTNGRAVFAVPGPISNPYSEGTKWLVNQGATLISSGFEVGSYLGLESNLSQAETSKTISDDSKMEEKIVEYVTSGPASVEMLVAELNCSISDVLVALSALELQGRLVKDGILWYPR